MGNTKTRQEGGIASVSDQDLGVMTGEISPDIMFWGVCQKVMRMGANGYKVVWMGAYRPIGKEGTKNKEKRGPNGRDEVVLGSIHTVKSSREVATMGIVFG